MFISVHFLGFFSLFHSINILNYTDKQSTAQIHPNLQCKPSTLIVCEIRERHIRKKQTTCLLSQILQFLSSYDSSRRCQLPVWKKKLYSTSFIPIKEHDRRTYFLTVCWYLRKRFTLSDHNHRPSNENKLLSAVNVVVALCIRPDYISWTQWYILLYIPRNCCLKKSDQYREIIETSYPLGYKEQSIMFVNLKKLKSGQIKAGRRPL